MNGRNRSASADSPAGLRRGGRVRRTLVTAALAALAVAIVSLPPSARPVEGSNGGGDEQFKTEFVGGREAVAGRVIVKFRKPAGGAGASAEVERELDADSNVEVGGAGARLIHSRSKSAAELAQILSARADVEYAHPDYVGRGGATPNDSQYSQLWGMKNTGQAVQGQPGVAGAHIDAEGAWNFSTGSRESVVGVIDSGIDYNHPDLAPNVWSAPAPFSVNIRGQQINCPAGSHGFNAINRTCDPLDDHNHGTHVSGTIGAVGNNATGVAGVNWTASIMASKWLDSQNRGSTSGAMDAIEFTVQAKQALGAGANVRVLNNSWFLDNFTPALEDQIRRAEQAGMLFVAIAGNNATDNDVTPRSPSGHRVANVIGVAATDNRDQLASFSNWGKTSVHLGAPGVGVLSTVRNNSYAFFQGTSMATPHVSGAAALLLSRCQLTTAGLKGVILTNTDPVAALAGRTTTGGRLNVHKAISACAAHANILDESKFFVRQHYADFLNREPDQAGLDFWTNQTTNCGNTDLLVCRINVSAAFFLSPEFQDTGFFVLRVQRVAFGRMSEAEGSRVRLAQFLTDARQVGNGFVDGEPGAPAVLEQNKQAYATQVVSSAAFAARFPQTAAAQYVAALYESAGVTPTAGEQQEAVDAFNNAGGSTAGRVAALRKVAESASVRGAEFRGAFVLMQYFGYMRRDPDQAGYDFWLGKLNEFGGDYIAAEMVKAFIISTEFRGRFGPA